ncbi:hypothetical protein HOI83_03165 [Candidatus Uhrbacteria bacterium]|jgi:hypothetical protein|nr:hypothetical protein [Candidatus Uhrbacteria bacterium]
MAIWPFSIFSSEDKTAPVMEEMKQGDKPVLLKAEKEADKIYKREVWWLEHKTGLRKGVVIFLIGVEAVFGLIGLYAFADYYLIDYVEEQQLVSTFFEGTGDLQAINTRQQPTELRFEDAVSIQSGQRYDILAFVENANVDWIAEVTYHFEYGDTQSEQEVVVVNQQTRLALTKLGLDGARDRTPRITIDNIRWQRINAHAIPDPILWKTERWNFEVSEITHDTDIEIGDRAFGRTNFTIKNKTGFGYYEVPVTVILKRGNTLVGVNRTTLSNLRGLEERTIQVDWFDTAPSASVVEIHPELNLFDEANFIPAGADDELDRRDIQIRR